MLLPSHDDPPTKHCATFRLSPAAPGKVDQTWAEEDTAKLAFNVGWCKAMQEAGWLAAVYGNVVVLHLESGRSWVVNCTPSVLEG